MNPWSLIEPYAWIMVAGLVLAIIAWIKSCFE